MTARFLEIVKLHNLEREEKRKKAEFCAKCGENNHTVWVQYRCYCKTPGCGATLHLPKE